MNSKKLGLSSIVLLALPWAALCAEIDPPSPQYVTSMQAVNAAALLNNVAMGRSLRLENVVLDGEGSAAITLDLERFQVFAPDARIVVHRRGGKKSTFKPPASAYFRGSIFGNPESIAVLSADPSGRVQGIVHRDDRFWVLGSDTVSNGGPASGLTSVEVRQDGVSAAVEPFQCGVDRLPQALREPALAQPLYAPAALPAGQYYQAKVAIETDGEFYNLFGSTSAATAYIGNLFAYGSTIYQRDIGTKLLVGSVSLWSGGPNADPWNHTDTYQGLTSFQSYWNANRTGIQRATAHFLSGRNLGGGIAYLNVLCDRSYGYGYSANISGNFSIANPRPIWDIIVVTHEIGHNFSSPHTHDYAGIAGVAAPIDSCATSGTLPGINSLSGGTPGAGNGTIMSYCHLLSGSYPNISLNFGKNHPYGISAFRESDRMSAYVAQVASAHPSCIAIGNASGSLTQLLTGDLNSDGRSDLVRLDTAGAILYSTNLSSWSNVPGNLTQIVTGDFNGDGKADLAGINSGGYIYYSTNLTNWVQIPGFLTQLVTGDFNGDGKDDLAGINSNNYIYYSTNLTNWVRIPGLLRQLVSGDFNGDGKDDLAGINSNNYIYYSTNRTNWVRIPGLLKQLVSGDFNGDGKDDLAGINSNNYIYYSTNRTNWVRIPGLLKQLVSGDFNGDGKADLAGINSSDYIYYSTNRTNWVRIPGLLTQLVSGDFNGDGKTDLAGVNSSDYIYYSTNLTNWINIPGQVRRLATP